MKPKSFALIILVVVATLTAGWLFYDNIEKFFFSSGEIAVRIPAEKVEVSDAQEEQQERIPMPPRHPVSLPEVADVTTEPQLIEPPLPASLEEADPYLDERLQQLISDRNLLALVNLNYFIQKLVLFIDNLPEKSIPRLHLPITPPKPGFITSIHRDQQVIGPRNAARYSAYVRLVEAIPDAPLLRLYRGLYPLFQQAYRDAGDPNAHFNDRLIQVIDNLLDTPEPREPITVIHHVSRYKYADELLEAGSAGQKILLRMGVENTQRVKEKLRRLREGLVRKDW